jgi:ribose/xylose/arabinose/galactoside ABC-type transport system permease subunit
MFFGLGGWLVGWLVGWWVGWLVVVSKKMPFFSFLGGGVFLSRHAKLFTNIKQTDSSIKGN